MSARESCHETAKLLDRPPRHCIQLHLHQTQSCSTFPHLSTGNLALLTLTRSPFSHASALLMGTTNISRFASACPSSCLPANWQRATPHYPRMPRHLTQQCQIPSHVSVVVRVTPTPPDYRASIAKMDTASKPSQSVMPNTHRSIQVEYKVSKIQVHERLYI
jgi:hypothetical protein